MNTDWEDHATAGRRSNLREKRLGKEYISAWYALLIPLGLIVLFVACSLFDIQIYG